MELQLCIALSKTDLERNLKRDRESALNLNLMKHEKNNFVF